MKSTCKNHICSVLVGLTKIIGKHWFERTNEEIWIPGKWDSGHCLIWWRMWCRAAVANFSLFLHSGAHGIDFGTRTTLIMCPSPIRMQCISALFYRLYESSHFYRHILYAMLFLISSRVYYNTWVGSVLYKQQLKSAQTQIWYTVFVKDVHVQSCNQYYLTRSLNIRL